jgi:hypothetical protein
MTPLFTPDLIRFGTGQACCSGVTGWFNRIIAETERLIARCSPKACGETAMSIATLREFDPAKRGYHAVYRENEVNHCPGCGRTHWYVGRSLAECGFCSTALPLAESHRQGAMFTSTHRSKPVWVSRHAA